jgi:hypothetical protein
MALSSVVAVTDSAIDRALRDNPPGDDATPDDQFVPTLGVQAICIWTSSSVRGLRRLLRR